MTDQYLKSFPPSRVTSGIRSSTRIFLLIALLILFGLFRYLYPERPMENTGLRALSDGFFAIGLLILILLMGGGVGLKIIRWLRIPPSSYLETIIFVVPIGLGVFAYGILTLGLLGLLEAQYLILWFVILFFWTYNEWRELVSTGKNRLGRVFGDFNRASIGKKALLAVFALIFLLTLFQALTPPWDYDGLMYHLQGPRIFLNSGKILPLPDIWGANGPFTIEMLYMFGLRFSSDTFAKLLHMGYAILLVLATFAFGRRFLGREGGWIAAVVLVAIPIFPIWASWAYADMAWAVYEFLGLYALILWVGTRHREWLVVSGLTMGLALGSKYLALGSAVVLGLVVIWASRRLGWRLILQNAAIFWGVALFVGLPWYLKNWFWTGNPVYPLYFGGLSWPEGRVRLLMSYLYSFGTGHRLSDYVLLPWNIYAQYQRYSTLLRGIELPSLLFPFLLIYPFVRHKRIIHLLAVIVLLRLVVWAIGSQQIRFLLPILPGLSVLTASTFLGIGDKFKDRQSVRIFQGGVIGGVVIVTLIISVTLFRIRPLEVIVGKESKASFLKRRISDFSAISYIQEQLKPEDRVLFMWDGQGYYCDERCLPDTEQSRWTSISMDAKYDASKVSTQLREAGVTHLLLTKDLALILEHDPENNNAQAANYFLQQYSEQCTNLIYSDAWSSLYKITCQDENK